MADVALSILAFIVAIGVLVTVHEYGHFWVARRLGFKVQRFSVGFGRPLARWRGGPPDYTEYWLSTLPLGGYVKLLDEREGPVPEEERHRAFNRRPVSQRIAVLLAGPGFNFLFAIVAYWALFMAGVPGIKPIIGSVTEGSVAAQAGLAANDEIRAVGERRTETWEAAVLAILDELLQDGRMELSVRSAEGETRRVELDLRGRLSELTEPDALFPRLGMRPLSFASMVPATLGELIPGEAAELAGLQSGDRVLSADGERIHNWEQWVEFVRDRPGETVMVRILRNAQPPTAMLPGAAPGTRPAPAAGAPADAQELELPLTIGAYEEAGMTVGRIGAALAEPTAEWVDEIRSQISSEQRYGPVAAFTHGVARTWEMTTLTVRFLGRMLVGDVSVRNISGPVAIAGYAGDSAQAGLTAFLSFLGIVSISLGIINLLPIPILDGGQIVYQVAEAIKGSPLSERALIVGQQVGLLMILVLMTFVFYNDIARILS